MRTRSQPWPVPCLMPVLRRMLALCLLLLGLLGTAYGGKAAPDADPDAGKTAGSTVIRLDLDGPIGPASSDYVLRGLETATERHATAVILRIDTPGGLDTSMREIIRGILAATVPVVAYVAPSGAHAASAGTYILYASHVAAMAPGTNLGAATPVQIGAPGLPGAPEPGGQPGEKEKEKGEEPATRHPGLPEKAMNDAIAYIRSLAELRGRNVEFAEKAVREAASLSAEQALQQHVIEIIAADEPALLTKLDGRTVRLGDRTVTLQTRDATVVSVAPDWRTRLLAVITNPNVASLLMLIGVYGLILEFYSPGLIGPGVIGAICLLLALYAFHVLPVDYTGLALLVLGIGLMVTEAFVGAFGALGVGGLAAFVIGSILLMREEAPGFAVAWELVGGIALVLGGLFMLIGTYAMRARHRPVVAGREQMLGSTGPVLRWAGAEGQVRMHGELWHARASVPLGPGMQVRVTGIDGLTLEVEPEPAGKPPAGKD